MNSPLRSDLPFAIEDFEANQSEILLRMGDFFMRYLHRLRDAFDGDLTMAIVLGEIGQHNGSVFFSSREGIKTDLPPDERFDAMACCNAHSLSAATGIAFPDDRLKQQAGTDLDSWTTLQASLFWNF